MKTLPSALARLCNRLAAEQMKAQTWQLGQSLRTEYATRLAEGETPADLEANLHRRLSQASADQFRLSNFSKPQPRAAASNASRLPITRLHELR